MIRKAQERDIPGVAAIYDAILREEETGHARIGWVRGVYPTESTAREALEKGDLFVDEENGVIAAAARINREQVPEYADAHWQYPAPPDQVMVLHTLVVLPAASGRGLGSRFVKFYEDYARECGCAFLRMDTNEINAAARRLYRKLGFAEAGVVSCVFNGIPDVKLVCLEKRLADGTA